MDALFREAMAQSTAILGQVARTRRTSARSRARTTRRRATTGPQVDCIMFSRNVPWFCAVCRRALEAVLNLYTA